MKDFFFPAVISEWDSLDINIRNSSSSNSTYNINQRIKGLKLLTRLRHGLSHLGDHKFRHNFQDCVSAMCSCGQENNNSLPPSLPNQHCARKTLFHKINQVSGTILWQSDLIITKTLLFGDNKLGFETNKILLKSAIDFISLT